MNSRTTDSRQRLIRAPRAAVGRASVVGRAYPRQTHHAEAGLLGLGSNDGSRIGVHVS